MFHLIVYTLEGRQLEVEHDRLYGVDCHPISLAEPICDSDVPTYIVVLELVPVDHEVYLRYLSSMPLRNIVLE